MSGAQAQDGVGRADASPGMLRRRYSVPETIMRKYRLAQQCSESEEAASCARHSAGGSAGRGSSSPTEWSPHRMRRDRELMRKATLLRRLWQRAPSDCCEPHSPAGSRAELRRSPLAWSPPDTRRAVLATVSHSDSTFQSHAGGACSCTDAFTDSEISEMHPPPSPPAPPDDRSYSDSDPFSTSFPTAKETIGPPQEPPRCDRFVEESIERRVLVESEDDRNVLPYDRPLVVDTSAPSYELLEIVVSETVEGSGSAAPPTESTPATGTSYVRTAPSTRDLDIDIDRYVSNILVESLNSLTDQLESMNATMGNDCKISIVEKEIKVRLQNTGVNTIVHLSPTSNNQIIFGNEELCNEMTTTMTISRDECNNPVIRDERDESNDNLAPPPPRPHPHPAPTYSAPSFDALQHDDVNEAVLQQIQKLFRDELRHCEAGDRDRDAISHIEISNVVDVYVGSTVDSSSELVAVGAGNYFCDSRDLAIVPRFSAYPHTESMEVNTSSSEEAELAGSECTSLVDSLDDPNSPRGVASARRRALVRSAIDVLDLLPERAPATPPPLDATPPPREKPEAFFVHIEDDTVEPDPDDVTVAHYMPEKIKQRLYRRHRKRELRMECARRSKNQLKREVEMAWREEAAGEARRRLDRDCRAILEELLDDVIAKIAHNEFKGMRIKRRNRLQAKSDETLSRRSRKITERRTSLETATEDRCRRHPKPGGSRESRGDVVRTERHQIHGKMVARPSPSLAAASASRPPRRFYQKSEIHEGDKCIEILEILEYVNGSQSSPETTNSDESQARGRGSRSKKSRIPVPVYERTQRSVVSGEHMRLTGGDGGRGQAGAGAALAGLLLGALAADRPVLAPPSELPRERTNSSMFKGVFDIIPEERSSLSLESSASCEEHAVRSAATSPPRRLRLEQTTMTSPCNKSAGTSPMRAREGYREVGVGSTEVASSVPAGAAPARAVRRDSSDDKLSRDRYKKQDEATTTETGARLIADDRPEKPGRDEPSESAPVENRDTRARRDESSDEITGRGRRRRPPPAREDESSDSGDSGGSLLCSLAPRWLAPARRARRRPAPAPRRAPPAPPPPVPAPPAPSDTQIPTGGWSVTVAGSCRAALPHDVEMRLRFPHDRTPSAAARASRTAASRDCSCVQCAACSERTPRPALPAPSSQNDPSLTLTMKKEAQDSSIVASKMSRKSREHLPELEETYRASRSKVKSSMKTRRGYSLHCWLPDDAGGARAGRERAAAPGSALSVLGCAIIPELKPRVPTMSERDLTRVYTPRHYLRS